MVKVCRMRNSDVRFSGCKPEKIPVTMAKGIHLFPYRTQKLSLSAPMVLGWTRPGRVGRCRIQTKELPEMGVLFLCRSGARQRRFAVCLKELCHAAHGTIRAAARACLGPKAPDPILGMTNEEFPEMGVLFLYEERS